MNLEKLKENYEISLSDEKDALFNLNQPDYNYPYILMCLVDIALVKAINNFFSDKILSSFKKEFYQAGLLKIFLHEKFDNNNYTSSNIFLVAAGFSYAVISDSNKLINKYLKFDDNFLDTFGSSYAKAIQACFKGDNSGLQEQIENLERHTDKKSIAKNYAGIPVAFKGILQKDKMLVEQGINQILAKHNKQEHPAVVKDYINIEALTLVKLAYRKGIIVEIDNPLLPKEMIPVEELEIYEGYDFLEEIFSLVHRVPQGTTDDKDL